MSPRKRWRDNMCLNHLSCVIKRTSLPSFHLLDQTPSGRAAEELNFGWPARGVRPSSVAVPVSVQTPGTTALSTFPLSQFVRKEVNKSFPGVLAR